MSSILDLLKNKFVFDVGCNVGNKTLAYQSAGASVIGFEPQPEVAAVYQQRTGAPVEVIALADEESTKPFWRNQSGSGLSSMCKEFMDAWQPIRKDPWDEPVSIPTSTLDHMISKYGRPYYIKLDVEGFELQVLQGLSQPVEIISLEWSTPCKEAGYACLDYLGRTNYYNFVIGDSLEFISPIWRNYKEISKFLNQYTSLEVGDVFIKRSSAIVSDSHPE
jgi:FkbM family methyltransferase